ncbi:hypothetical protein [Actinomadura gamaensis]|uniref:Major facilitator superfamily (MFS) profile domain-containing protein n=1 Tax=Actinomadura gamaensis TaxID=1763541 RepID=A0ABV9UBV3_9ACTN
MVPLVAGSVVCALSSSVVPMIVGRGVQGVGMGLIPLGISALRDVLPPERLGGSIALISSSMGIGGAAGLGYGVSLALLGSTWGVLVVALVINGGVGLAYGAMPALIMGAVPRSETGAANSFDTLMRSLGTSTGAALVGVILSQLTVSVAGHILPSEDGFHTAMLLGCGVAVVAALVTLTLPKRSAPATAMDAASAEPAAPARS